MTASKVWILTAGMIIFTAGMLFFMRSRGPEISGEVRAHSEKYVEDLGAQAPDKLTAEQKLLLLHSYSNLKKDAEAVKLAEAMIPELQNLDPERRNIFTGMVIESYKRLGETEKISGFRQKVFRDL